MGIDYLKIFIPNKIALKMKYAQLAYNYKNNIFSSVDASSWR